MSRPPQWLFDEIAALPPEIRGWALGFMCAGWLAGREDGALMALDKANDKPRSAPLVEPCSCGCTKAGAAPSTRFVGQGGWDLSCRACGADLAYLLDLDDAPPWLEVLPTSRGTMRDNTSEPPEE